MKKKLTFSLFFSLSRKKKQIKPGLRQVPGPLRRARQPAHAPARERAQGGRRRPLRRDGARRAALARRGLLAPRPPPPLLGLRSLRRLRAVRERADAGSGAERRGRGSGDGIRRLWRV